MIRPIVRAECARWADDADRLFRDGVIDEAEYRRRMRDIRAELADQGAVPVDVRADNEAERIAFILEGIDVVLPLPGRVDP